LVTEDQGRVIVSSVGSAAIDPRLVRQIRGSIFGAMDVRFFVIVMVSICLHVTGLVVVHRIKVAQNESMQLEQIPERFAKLLVDKPLPKAEKKPVAAQQPGANAQARQAQQETKQAGDNGQQPGPVTEQQRVVAKQAVAKQVARVEQKIRTVGVLGMLTGVGSTTRGPAVVDVLGAVRSGKEKFQDLDKALEGVTGLQKADNIATAQQKLVKSKDIAVNQTASIDNLISGISQAKAADLAKQGDFVIQKPESIEGAASASAKRDTRAINDVVLSHKAGIRMSYDKFFKRDPSLQGKITVRFTIAADGSVTNVEVVENTTGNSELENEIVRKVKMWKFEPVPEGDATVTYPFVFRPS
jgi:TonB family protein